MPELAGEGSQPSAVSWTWLRTPRPHMTIPAAKARKDSKCRPSALAVAWMHLYGPLALDKNKSTQSSSVPDEHPPKGCLGSLVRLNGPDSP